MRFDREFVIGVVLAGLVWLGITSCNKPIVSTVKTDTAKVNKVIEWKHDTVKQIDIQLKKQIVYVDTGRIVYIHDTLDRIIPPIGDENVCIAENQLRQCVKCQDSLIAYKQKVNIDSITLDSVAKIAKKTPDTVMANSTWTRIKDLGTGMLVGAGLRSLF